MQRRSRFDFHRPPPRHSRAEIRTGERHNGVAFEFERSAGEGHFHRRRVLGIPYQQIARTQGE
jgi:hypothetical protein